MNGGTPYLVPWPTAMPLTLPPHLSKLAAYAPFQHPQQTIPMTQFPQFTTITLPGGQVYPLSSLVPQTIMNQQHLANTIPKYLYQSIPGVKVIRQYVIYLLRQEIFC